MINALWKNAVVAVFVALTTWCTESSANPVLTPGVWKNITPSGVAWDGATANYFGVTMVAIDPSHPSTIYCNGDTRGLWRSSDGGATWSLVGTPPATTDWAGIQAGKVNYLDYPTYLEIDPSNSEHLYAAQGVRGNTQGFWESTDGGATWVMPQGFFNSAPTHDMGFMQIDPSDFRHVLLGSHSYQNAGVLETKDGGATLIIHPPLASWGGGTMGVNFLYYPALGIGNANTWLICTNGNGTSRTTDAGSTWTSIPSMNASHGGNFVCYSKTGVLYSGSENGLLRSTDNGQTWAQISKGPAGSSFFSIVGDGNYLYTAQSCACAAGFNYNTAYYVSQETDGLNWTPYQGGAQKFGNGPYTMRFDKVNRIIYSTNWGDGLWALKVIDPASIAENSAYRQHAGEGAPKNRVYAFVDNRLLAPGVCFSRFQSAALYDVRGRHIDAVEFGGQAPLR